MSGGEKTRSELEIVGDGVVALGDEFVRKQDVDDSVDFRLRNLFLEHRRDMLRKRLPLSGSYLLLGLAQ